MNLNPGSSKIVEKRPPFTFKSGAIYDGRWCGTMRDGYGLQICITIYSNKKGPDGARYEGEWKENKACGNGKFWHVDGDIFEGEWKDDKANGFGTYVHVNGARYEGNWKEDLQDGEGIEMWADGSRYEGCYKDGKKHGTGNYTWVYSSIKSQRAMARNIQGSG